jgi:hypothetical protein
LGKMKKLSLKAAIWPGFLPIFSKVRDGVIPFRDSLAAYERTWTKFPPWADLFTAHVLRRLDRIRTSTSSISL